MVEPTVSGVSEGIHGVLSDRYLDAFIPKSTYLKEKTVEKFITTFFEFHSI
jgi:hypothetical protein